jgi:uncharacterized membrane protein YhaH (DUF805 family)
MTFTEAIQAVLSKYADFGGRARRSEYWYWTLASLIAYVAIFVIGQVTSETVAGVLFIAFALGVFLPGLAVGVRRLHDTGRSGWWLLIAIVPIIGAIVWLVFALQDSTSGVNKYGPSPKEQPGAHAAA